MNDDLVQEKTYFNNLKQQQELMKIAEESQKYYKITQKIRKARTIIKEKKATLMK